MNQRFAHLRLPYHFRIGKYIVSTYSDWSPYRRGTDDMSYQWVSLGFVTIAWRYR